MMTIWIKTGIRSGILAFRLLIDISVLSMTARLLEPEGRGLYIGIVVWVYLFARLFSLSLENIVVHTATTHIGLNWLPKTFGSLLILTFILTLLSFTTLWGLYFFSSGSLFGDIPKHYLLFGFTMIPFLIWNQYQTSILLVINRIEASNRAQIAGSVALLVLTFFFTYLFEYGVMGALFARILSQVLISILGISVLWKTVKGYLVFSLREIVNLVRGGIKLHPNTVGNALRSHADVLLINYYLTSIEVAWYQLSNKLVDITLMGPQAFSEVILTRMGKKTVFEIWPEQKRMILKIIPLMALLMCIAYILAPGIIPLVAGNKFEKSVPIFHWLLPVILGRSYGMMMANQIIGRGLFKLASILGLSLGLLSLLLNYLFIPEYGIKGAIYAALISYAIIPVLLNSIFYWWYNRVDEVIKQ